MVAGGIHHGLPTRAHCALLTAKRPPFWLSIQLAHDTGRRLWRLTNALHSLVSLLLHIGYGLKRLPRDWVLGGLGSLAAGIDLLTLLTSTWGAGGRACEASSATYWLWSLIAIAARPRTAFPYLEAAHDKRSSGNGQAAAATSWGTKPSPASRGGGSDRLHGCFTMHRN